MGIATVAGTSRSPRARLVGALTLAAGLPLLLAACTSGSPTTAGSKQSPAAHTQGSASSSTSPPKVSQVKITVTPAPDTRAVKPTARVEVRADDGRVDQVVLKTTTGKTVDGTLGSDGVWRSRSGLLPYATTFTVTAHGVDTEGLGRQVSTHFTTVRPRKLLTTSISPLTGSVVGVGMPVIVRLSAPVTHRGSVEKRLVVSTSKPVEGAWSWVSDSELHWRPKHYWPAGTNVKLAVNLNGVHAGNGLWGDERRDITFHVGDAMVSTVDVSAHRMTITRNGVVLRVVPITTGKAGFVTREGIKVILSKERSRIMDAATINIPKNDPNYYRLKVFWALRVTWSGEFVHAAPWSQAEQGLANVSHGCTGMSMANAEWFYNLSTVGDVVKFIHSPRSLEPGNGWTDWNVPWSTWLKGDALHNA
jgi:lipoprotein-anchoring transpeptidase ErfK/SrfK